MDNNLTQINTSLLDSLIVVPYTDTTMPNDIPNYAGFFRRLMAVIYDSLILFALWMIATALILPFSQGQAISAGTLSYQLYLLIVTYFFLVGFWHKGGQTAGMMTWQLHVCCSNDESPSLRQASIRYLAMLLTLASCGLGFCWILFDKKKRSLHDILAGTVVKRRPRQSN